MEAKLKIFLIISLIGLLLLIFLSQKIEPKLTTISEIINRSKEAGISLNTEVKIMANITRITDFTENKIEANRKAFQILTLRDSTGTITAISGSKISLKKIINQSKQYMITGKLQEYNNTLQISINKIQEA